MSYEHTILHLKISNELSEHLHTRKLHDQSLIGAVTIKGIARVEFLSENLNQTDLFKKYFHAEMKIFQFPIYLLYDATTGNELPTTSTTTPCGIDQWRNPQSGECERKIICPDGGCWEFDKVVQLTNKKVEYILLQLLLQ